MKMFREMRRSNQILSEEESIAVLERGTSGVLAVQGDAGYPYAVPLSYLYMEGNIYFHTAISGHKVDAIKNHEQVSFCVIDQDQVVSAEFTTYYRSVIAFGRAQIIENKDEKLSTLIMLGNKYSPDIKAQVKEVANKDLNHLLMIKVHIEHLSGKEGRELAKKRRLES